MTAAAALDWVRRGHEQQARREVDRLATLATRPSLFPEEISMTDRPVTDPSAPAPTSLSIEDWMAHETKRKAKREADRLAAEPDRYGRTRVTDRRWGGRGI